jgi:divalent metal cation (Fe/Co/Zn/Cd) transporter
LAVLSLAVMPTLAFVKQRVRTEMGSRALVADSKETWVCSYLSLTLLLGVGAYALLGWVVGRPCWCARDAPDHPLARMGDAN